MSFTMLPMLTLPEGVLLICLHVFVYMFLYVCVYLCIVIYLVGKCEWAVPLVSDLA